MYFRGGWLKDVICAKLFVVFKDICTPILGKILHVPCPAAVRNDPILIVFQLSSVKNNQK